MMLCMHVLSESCDDHCFTNTLSEKIEHLIIAFCKYSEQIFKKVEFFEQDPSSHKGQCWFCLHQRRFG